VIEEGEPVVFVPEQEREENFMFRKIPSARRILVLGLLIPPLFACGADRDQAEPQDFASSEVDSASDADPGPEAADVMSIVADTTPESVWAHLEASDYVASWQLWPDREPFYEGIDPHGILLNTYLNGPAFQGLMALKDVQGDASELPYGSMIVKENYSPDSVLMATTVMYKVPGYDPPHQDWWWMKRLADGTVEASGRVESCAQCHGKAATPWDYLLTANSDSGS
jgi:hypothetical protein